jgi:hypothetical protein
METGMHSEMRDAIWFASLTKLKHPSEYGVEGGSEWATTTAAGDWGLPTFDLFVTRFFLRDMGVWMQIKRLNSGVKNDSSRIKKGIQKSADGGKHETSYEKGNGN